MIVEQRTLADITRQALEVLSRELGSADTIRFLNQFTTGQGDYTAERDVLLRDQTLDQILSDIKNAKAPDCGGA